MAIALAMTGASGALYGLRLLEQLLQTDEAIYLLFSKAARIVIHTETDLKLPKDNTAIANYLSAYYQAPTGKIQVFSPNQWTAPVASGSHVPRALVICPCSSGTLGAIANGLNRTLIDRAAEVVLKEQKKLIIVHRETPLSVIQLQNMLRLAQAGAVIMPANPGFYKQPQSVNDIVDFMVARILDHLEIKQDLIKPWG